MTLLATEDLQVSIAGKCICSALNLSIAAGQVWGVLGANGAGKTTLLHTLAGLRSVDQGVIKLAGQPIETMKRRDVARQLGLLPQDSRDAFPATVLETALIGRHPYLSAWQWEDAEDMQKAQAALTAVGLQGLAGRQVDSLSGGERRRLALATLLTQNPRLLLLDEPANHLDLRYQVKVLALIRQQVLQQQGAAVMVLHDINQAARFCDCLLLLFADGVTRQGSVDDMLTMAQLEDLYGYPIRCVDSEDGRFFVPNW